jgi:hypothetical protein
MGSRLQLETHLTQDEIRGYYLTSADVVEQTRWLAILLLSEGVRSEEVARVTGYCTPWVRTLARRYNQKGAAAMRDGRHENPGAAGGHGPAGRTRRGGRADHSGGGWGVERPEGGCLDVPEAGAHGPSAARVGVPAPRGPHPATPPAEAPGW